VPVHESRLIDELLAEAEAHPVAGWDFSWLGGRMVVEPPPWDFAAIVVRRACAAADMLDMGTGGGEWLAALAHRPPRTVATEAWAPNVDIAGARLRALGVTVVRDEGAPDNVEQAPDETRGRLPFPSASFELDTNRHEAFVASEVARVLVSGGRFVTQQVGGDYDDFYRLLELPAPARTRTFDLPFAAGQIERSGLAVVDSGEGRETTTFADVGALAWYLRAVPWAVPGFTIETHRESLEALQGRPLTVRQPAFWLEAVKP